MIIIRFYKWNITIFWEFQIINLSGKYNKHFRKLEINNTLVQLRFLTNAIFESDKFKKKEVNSIFLFLEKMNQNKMITLNLNAP